MTAASRYFFCVTPVTSFSRNAGVSEHPSAKKTLVGTARERAQGDLDGRTGETDSEVEEVDD